MTALVATAALLPGAVVLGAAALVETTGPGRTTALPTRTAWRAALDEVVEWIRRALAALDDEAPTSPREVAHELLFLAFAPGAAVRAMIHVGGAVFDAGGRDPGPIDVGLRASSPVLEVDAATDLRLRVATACYGGFWLAYGTTALDPIGRLYFAANVGVLVIDPGLWLWHRVLSSRGSALARGHTDTETNQ
jgi:hypothetical protein